jgi:hypothetical protein
MNCSDNRTPHDVLATRWCPYQESSETRAAGLHAQAGSEQLVQSASTSRNIAGAHAYAVW